MEARVRLTVRGRLLGGRDLGVRLLELLTAYVVERAGRRQGGRTGLDDPSVVQRVEPVLAPRVGEIRAAARPDGVPGLRVTTVPPLRPRVVSTSPA